MDTKSKLFEQQLNLGLSLLTLLLRFVDLSQDLEQRQNPRVRPIEDLNL